MYFLYFLDPSTLDSHCSVFSSYPSYSAYQLGIYMDGVLDRKLLILMEKFLEIHTIPKKTVVFVQYNLQ